MTDLQVAIIAAGVVLAANFIAAMLHFLYKALSDSLLRDSIRNIIFEIDKFADKMENEQKRRIAIQQLGEVLGWWRRILLPAALIGWIIDAEVAAIRKMQKATGTQDLHIEEDDGNEKHNP